jgi:hypothetical protein
MRSVFLLIPFILLLLNSCCKEPKCGSITEADRALIPYQMGDTVRFQSLLTDSVVVYVVEEVGEYFAEILITDKEGPGPYGCKICVPVYYVQLKKLPEFYRNRELPIYIQGKVLKHDGKALIKYDGGDNTTNYPPHGFLLSDLTPVPYVINEQEFHEVYVAKADVSNTVYPHMFSGFAFSTEEGLLAFQQAGFDDTWEIFIE